MLKPLSRTLVNSAIKNGIAKQQEAEEYIFGINVFLTIVVNIASALLIGIIMGMPFEIALFIFVFKMLRKYVGGSHSKTALRCYITSCITYVIALMLIKYCPSHGAVVTTITFICYIVICLISPVEAENKPLDDLEKKVYKRRSIVSISIVIVAFMILRNMIQAVYWSNVIAVSVITVTVFAIRGKLNKDCSL